MSISSEITRIKNNISNAYDKCEEKGATIPTDKNSANLATTIDSITGGAGNDMSLGQYVLEDGIYKGNISDTLTTPDWLEIVGDFAFTNRFAYQGTNQIIYKEINFNKVREINGNRSFNQTFKTSNLLEKVSFPNLEKITHSTTSDVYSFGSAFNPCSAIKTVEFPKLKEISSARAFSYTFANSGIEEIEFPELEKITGNRYTFDYCFDTNRNIRIVRFPKLKTISGTYVFNNCFRNCTSLTDVYFNGFTSTTITNANANTFSSFLNGTGTTTTHTLHFPANMEGLLSKFNNYPNFNGTAGSVVIAYDLPATE